jgi:hypothetical protein
MDREALAVLIKALKFLWPFLAGLWVLGLVFQFLMIANRKADVKIFDRRLMLNPFNLQFFGDRYLTLRGLKWRNLSWICYGAFAVILVLIFGMYYYFKGTGAR